MNKVSEQPIQIIVAGPRGKMGSETIRMISETDHFQLAAVVDSKNGGKRVADLQGLPKLDAAVYEDLQQCIDESNADVLIDFTTPEVGKDHAKIAVKHRLRAVIGTSGFTENDVRELSKLAEQNDTGIIIAPNFAIGAVLMMKFSKLAAKYFPAVEIIEQHHDGKLDAPSGTAVKTAEMMAEVREAKKQGHPDESESLEGARGAEMAGMRIHSVRLPGLVAHQEVIFGGDSETLKIRHDSIHRKSFMSGVKLAVETVVGLNVLVYGLDEILE
ncbi:MAG TPA: 4-hydroxy-tetrahydrodipicolinate reductase [Bacillales bacterium]|nr:4-hydroxy-tetrahydrodipicolinate reductase [Bacillales bacterium]